MAAIALVVALLALMPARHRADQGAVRFLGSSTPALDVFTRALNPLDGEFLRRHFTRMLVYSPYFDNKTRWYPNGWVYKDAYAIYRGTALAGERPDWILRNAAGEPLYIPYACSQGACPQYAADITNPQYRRSWIAAARTTLARGYRGLFIDDVNMQLTVSDGLGRPATPIAPVSGRQLTARQWRHSMALFMEEVRRSLPGVEIAHNVQWLAATPARTADPDIAREIRAASYINLERGVNDPGLRGGDGPYSLRSLLSYIDAVHALGRAVVLQGTADDAQGIEYSLASYLLVSNGQDLVSAQGMTPAHWWPGFDLDLGEALGARRSWEGLLRRDFSGGMALVAEPDSASHEVRLPSAMRTLAGNVVTTLTLQPASGAVLRRL